MAVADEETMDEQDKGHLTYQESKVFHAEPHLCSVYDHHKRRVVTFEVYGLDTQDILHKQYTYNEFDSLFRFNAELMNPNRKEGRYHWVIERLEIGQVGSERKLRLAAEVTKEVPELPIYETTRKIPTGRMDLKERQRLRDQMDMLNIKREEKIRAKKEASKRKFLEHIFNLQEETKWREKEQEEAISHEREKRYQWQLQMENEEEEEGAKAAVLQKQRRIAAENKDQAHEEATEEDLRQLRLRWKATDKEKAQHIADARARKERDTATKAEQKKQVASAARALQSKRESAWTGRDKRVQKKMDDAVHKALQLIPEIKRLANLKRERNNEYLQDWNDMRWPVFHDQLERTQERERLRKAENEAVEKYHVERSIPKKIPTKGRKGKAAKTGGKKKDKEGDKAKDAKKASKDDDDDGGGDAKKDTERIVDGVEAKMREQMAEQRRRQDLEKKRDEKVQERVDKIKSDELKRIKDYKEKMRLQEEKKQNEANERRLILKTKEEERQRAAERQKEEDKRLTDVRNRHVLSQEQKQLEYLMVH